MVVSCCCNGCDTMFVPGKVVGFFGFPRDKKRKDLWLKNIGIKGFVPTKYSRVCIKHFTPDSYVYHEARRRTFLNKDAVPTIFNLSKNGRKKTKGQKHRTSSFMYVDVNDETHPSDREEEEVNPIAEQDKNNKESSPRKRGRPRKNAEKTASSIEMSKDSVNEVKKNEPVVFDKTAFVLKYMGPSYLPKVKCTKPVKVPLNKIKRYRYVFDFTAADMQKPEMAIRMLRMAKKKMVTQKAELKLIHEEATMLAAKRTSLNELLRLLVKVTADDDENTDNLTNDVKSEDHNITEEMSHNSDFEANENNNLNVGHEMSDSSEDQSDSFDFGDDESDNLLEDIRSVDSKGQIDLDSDIFLNSDLTKSLETLEDDEYYIIQIT